MLKQQFHIFIRKIKFLILRLKNSSPAEIIHRINEALLVFRIKKACKKNRNILRIPDSTHLCLNDLDLPDFHCRVTNKAIQDILNGETYFPTSDKKEIRKFEESNRHLFFSDITFPDKIDIRAVWEPARLQHLTTLLIFALNNPKSPHSNQIKQFAKKYVINWIDENPFLWGPHYISAMECGLRIPVFFYCLKGLDNLTEKESRLITTTIYQHAWLISKRISLYSSLGNHTITECAGLIFAGAMFHKSDKGKTWLKTGLKLMTQEIDHQILDDGGPAEQSLNYHQFIIDLYQLSINFLEKNSLSDCSAIKERVSDGEQFMQYFHGITDMVPNIGDCDDGFAVAPQVFPARAYPDAADSSVKSFHYFGCTLIRHCSIFFSFDHGPLGMAPLYNHGHADALSITLSVQGKPFLVDTGTYRYNGIPTKWRCYFKGTRAHNTVCIDGLDQAIQETGFIWSKPYTCKLINIHEETGKVLLMARHTGYRHLKRPVDHNRTILFDDSSGFTIQDSFRGKEKHSFELNFHFHPDVILTRDNSGWIAKNNGVTIHINLKSDNEFILRHGESEPPFGWFSNAYGQKQATSVLSCFVTGKADSVKFETEISLKLRS